MLVGIYSNTNSNIHTSREHLARPGRRRHTPVEELSRRLQSPPSRPVVMATSAPVTSNLRIARDQV